jgi:hypothetical protein
MGRRGDGEMGRWGDGGTGRQSADRPVPPSPLLPVLSYPLILSNILIVDN